MTEIYRVYEEIYCSKREYCVICLRSADERRMVQIKSLQNFIQSVNLPLIYNAEFQKLCYICERQALAAHRFRVAVNLSSCVHNLYTMLTRSDKLRNNVRQHLRGTRPMTGLMSNVPEWEARLGGVRARAELRRTDVLAVDVQEHIEVQSAVTTYPEVANDSRDSCADQYVTPDGPPMGPPHSPPQAGGGGGGRLADEMQEPEIYMESMEMVDDAVDPIEIKVEEEEPEVIREDSPLGEGATPAPPTTLGHVMPQPKIIPIEQLLETKSPSYLLHPIVESNGVLNVPSLSAQIVHGHLVPVDNSSLVSLQTPKLALHNGVNLNLISDPRRISSVLKGMRGQELTGIPEVNADETLGGLIALGGMTTNDGYHSTGTNPFGQGTHPGDMFEMGYDGAQQIYNSAPHGRAGEIASIIIEDDGESETEVDRKQRGKAIRGGKRRQSERETIKRSKTLLAEGGGQKEGEAVERRATDARKETDWEDKIPMDVISFVDATDPHAPAAFSEAAPAGGLGKISDVHSVREREGLRDQAAAPDHGSSPDHEAAPDHDEAPPDRGPPPRRGRPKARGAHTYSVHQNVYSSPRGGRGRGARGRGRGARGRKHTNNEVIDLC